MNVTYLFVICCLESAGNGLAPSSLPAIKKYKEFCKKPFFTAGKIRLKLEHGVNVLIRAPGRLWGRQRERRPDEAPCPRPEARAMGWEARAVSGGGTSILSSFTLPGAKKKHRGWFLVPGFCGKRGNLFSPWDSPKNTHSLFLAL